MLFPVMKTGMRGPSTVPELQKDFPPLLMDGGRNLFPGGFHFVRVDAGAFIPAIRLRGDCRCFRNNQAGGSTLRIVFRHNRLGDPFCSRARPRQGCHGDSVGQREIANRDR